VAGLPCAGVVSAPTGRQIVAAGGAARPHGGPTRNPWKADEGKAVGVFSPLLAPAGRRRFSNPRTDTYASSAPSGRKEEDEHAIASTGCASGGFAAAPLHPWLQSAAPLGREEEDGNPHFAMAFAHPCRLRLGMDGPNMRLWRPVLSKGHAFPTAGNDGTRQSAIRRARSCGRKS